MGHMIIDGRKVEFTDEKNVLSVIRKAGITIPSLGCSEHEANVFPLSSSTVHKRQAPKVDTSEW